MLDILSRFADIITSLVSYLVHGITTLLSLIGKIPQFATFLIQIVNVAIPSIFKPFIIAGISISIVYLIVGRSHG